METESIIRRFDEVEQQVERILDAYAALKKDNTELLAKIERLEQELQGKSEAVKQFAQERDLVRLRIDGLLTRLGAQSHDALNE